MSPTGSYTVSTVPCPGSWAAPFRGPHPRQAGSLSSTRLGLTCEIDSHGHDDNNDPHDDEGDTEQPGQAAQPPSAVQVPLLHATSGLQREGGRDLRKAVPSRLGWGHPLPWPPEPTPPTAPSIPASMGMGSRLLLQNWLTPLVGTPCRACPWLEAESSSAGHLL